MTASLTELQNWIDACPAKNPNMVAIAINALVDDHLGLDQIRDLTQRCLNKERSMTIQKPINPFRGGAVGETA